MLFNRPEDLKQDTNYLKLVAHSPLLKDFPSTGIPSVELIRDADTFGGDYWRHPKKVTDANDDSPCTAYLWDTDTKWFQINVYDNVSGAFPMAPTKSTFVFWERPLPYVKTKLIGQERLDSEALNVGYPLSWFRDITRNDLRFKPMSAYQGYTAGEIYRKPRAFPDFVYEHLNMRALRFDLDLLILAMHDTAFGRKALVDAPWSWNVLHFFMPDSSPQEQAAALRTMFANLRKHNYPTLLTTASAWIRPVEVDVLSELSRIRRSDVPDVLKRLPSELLRDLRKDDRFAAWLFRFPQADAHLSYLLKDPPPQQQMYVNAALRQCAQTFLSVTGRGLKKDETIPKDLMSDIFLGVRDRVRQRFPDLNLSGAMLACARAWLTYASGASITVEPGFTLPL